jgi:hypothetical protein
MRFALILEPLATALILSEPAQSKIFTYQKTAPGSLISLKDAERQRWFYLHNDPFAE